MIPTTRPLPVRPTPTCPPGCRRAPTSSSAALEAAADDAPCWTWWGEPATAGAVARHQVQEAAVHRWDAEAAAGDVQRDRHGEAASDAVDEFLAVSLGERARRAAGIGDDHRERHRRDWTVGRDGGPVADIVGTASDLLLVLYRRVDHAAVTIEGDPELAATFLGLASTTLATHTARFGCVS